MNLKVNSKKYYNKHKVDILDRYSSNYHNNNGKERQRTYVENHRDKVLTYQSNYYHTHKKLKHYDTTPKERNNLRCKKNRELNGPTMNLFAQIKYYRKKIKVLRLAIIEIKKINKSFILKKI